MAIETPKQASDVIIERIAKNFKRISKHRYYMHVVNNKYDEEYSFFLYDQAPYHMTKSTPLHSLQSYDLAYLENVIKCIREVTQLSITYVCFTGLKWPSNNKLIQYSKIRGEDVRREEETKS